ncbi:MAG: 3-hydroxyacyl-ACP dehydratase FabZ [Fibrella sp.]|nr:3-hydroxyacyl-ACP dehydratase FabZ [Armatimonadota bacterium]
MFAGIHNKDTFLEISAKELLDILPHRYPFLLVDRILAIEPGVRATGLKNVSFGEPFFVGHFPGHPIMPGVLIIEMMAQVSGVMLLTLPEHKGKLAYLAGIEKARFRKPVLPGDTLVAEVTLVKARGTMGFVKAEARVGGTLVCAAELMFALQSPNGDSPSGEEKTAE